jgi:small subunit ribosomal protein S16
MQLRTIRFSVQLTKVLKMVVIRLARDGRKKRPFHRLVVTDRRRARDSRLESVGYFNPLAAAHECALSIDEPRYRGWLVKGAQPSPRVRQLFSRWLKLKPSPSGALDTTKKET